MTNHSSFLLLLISVFCCVSCSKTTFLDIKPDNSLVVPTSLKDCQAILDADRTMSGENGMGVYPVLSWLLSDDYLVEENIIPSLTAEDKAFYRFATQPFVSGVSTDWNLAYRVTFCANEVLAILSEIQPPANDLAVYDQIKGSALFHRAFIHFGLLQSFAKPYDPVTAATDPGIPLRLLSDINEPVFRSSVAKVHDQVLEDLKSALELLPVDQPFPTRPNKPAVYALLARIFLYRGEFNQAHAYADSCLALKQDLMDYNGLQRIPRFNEEVLFHTLLIAQNLNRITAVHPDLFVSYAENDLRKSPLVIVKTAGTLRFRGSYGGSSNRFGGLATDEVLLIRAECAARAGNIEAALEDLNRLLEKRVVTGTFEPYTADTQEAALELVLAERRKELLFRGIRGDDLRRLNKEGRLTTIYRTLEGESYQLDPNSPLYVFPIPPEVIGFHPDMPQNPR